LVSVFAVVAMSYLIGAIPFGYIIAKSKGVDILKHGSGAIGATNVLRTLGTGPAVLSLVLDALKGVSVVTLARALSAPTDALSPVLAGFAAMAGHSFSPFIRFRGGKGVATGAGVLIALMPQMAVYAVLVFGVVVAITRYVSLGSMLAAVVAATAAWYTRQPWPYLLFVTPAAALVVFQHRANIRRLLSGKESKLGERVNVK